MNKEDSINELSRPCNLEKVKKVGSQFKIEASARECESLAERFSIPKVVFLHADCLIKKQAQKQKGDFLLKVHMEAEVIQHCVMTLNALPESIDEEFIIIFQISAEGDSKKTDESEVEFYIDDDDVEVISDFNIDVGAYVAEYLSLSMNPYPRQNKVSEQEIGYKVIREEDVSIKPNKKNPFAVLKDLKHKT